MWDLGDGRISTAGTIVLIAQYVKAGFYWDDVIGCDPLTGDSDFSNATDTPSNVTSKKTACCKSCLHLNGYNVESDLETSVKCPTGTRLSKMELNPGWWRASKFTSRIYECSTDDCRSAGGGKSTVDKPFGSLHYQDGTIEENDILVAAGNGTGEQLCQGISKGPMCSVCEVGAYRYTSGDVSTCVECADEGDMIQSYKQIPPRTWSK